MGIKLRARLYSRILLTIFSHQNLSGATIKQARRGARHLSLGLRLANPSELERALKLSEAIALSSNVENVMAQRQAGLVMFQYQLSPELWENYTRSDLADPHAIGLAEQRKPINFTFEQAHALIAGSTGSGKTETLRSVIMSLVTTYPVTELGLILIDPHQELEDFENEAHLIMPIATTPEQIDEALRFANQELAHRKGENIKDGRMIVIAIDEAAADEVLQNQSNMAIMSAIGGQARKYQMHLILGTQKPTHGKLPDILDKLMNKWIGQLSDASLSARVTGHAGLQCHKLTPKGDFLHIDGPNVERLQIAVCTQADYASLERTEVKSVDVPQTEVIELPVEPAQQKAGRPQLQLNPEWLAYYFYHNPHKLSHAMAKALGLTRSFHELHRDFCKRFITAYLNLRNEQKRIGA